MGNGLETLPDDIETLSAAWIVARAEAEAACARQSDDQALIAHLKLQIEKLNSDRYGSRSKWTARLLDQFELTQEELEAPATEDKLAAELARPKPRRQQPPWRRSRASGRRASRSRSICHASA